MGRETDHFHLYFELDEVLFQFLAVVFSNVNKYS